jgi:hypothetical protein
MEPSSAQPIYNEDGVDLTLIRWMLSLSVAQRVEYVQGVVESLEEIRRLNADTQSA